jgi:hypothetical protein
MSKRIYPYLILTCLLLSGCPKPTPRLLEVPAGEGNTTITSFSSAKKRLYSAIHNDAAMRQGAAAIFEPLEQYGTVNDEPALAALTEVVGKFQPNNS